MSTDRTAEILHYVSAMSRDIGEFRKETRTQIEGLQTQINDLRTEMHTQIGDLQTQVGELRTGFTELRKEVRALTNRFDRLEARVLENRANVDDLEIRVSALEGKEE